MHQAGKKKESKLVDLGIKHTGFKILFKLGFANVLWGGKFTCQVCHSSTIKALCFDGKRLLTDRCKYNNNDRGDKENCPFLSIQASI